MGKTALRKGAVYQFFRFSFFPVGFPYPNAALNQSMAYRLHPQARVKGKKAVTHSLLLLSRDKELRRQLQTSLIMAGLHASVLVTARNERQCFKALGETRPHLLVFDDDAREIDGMAFLRSLHQKAPETQVVYLTAHHTAERERAVRQLGVLYYTEKPPDSLLLSRLLTSALATPFAAEHPPPVHLPSPATAKRE